MVICFVRKMEPLKSGNASKVSVSINLVQCLQASPAASSKTLDSLGTCRHWTSFINTLTLLAFPDFKGSIFLTKQITIRILPVFLSNIKLLKWQKIEISQPKSNKYHTFSSQCDVGWSEWEIQSMFLSCLHDHFSIKEIQICCWKRNNSAVLREVLHIL